MEMEKIIKYTRLSEDVINEAIEKDKYKNLSKEEKNKVKQEKNKDIGNIKPDIEILQKYERGIVSIVDKLTLMNTKNGAILETLQNIEGLLINISKKL
jgi:flagellar biosynthesis/type III secretory pathway chaperone